MITHQQLYSGEEGRGDKPVASGNGRLSSTKPQISWVVRVDAALGALRRAVQRAAEYQGDSSRLSEQIALLRKARASEFEGDSQGADLFLAQALNGSSGDE